MAVFPTIAVFLLFLVVLQDLYTTQHKRNEKLQKGPGRPSKSPSLQKSTFQTPIYIYFFARTRTNLELKCLLDPGLSI